MDLYRLERHIEDRLETLRSEARRPHLPRPAPLARAIARRLHALADRLEPLPSPAPRAG